MSAATSRRAEFLGSIIGKPWEANARGPDAFDCWHLAAVVERHIFGRALPTVDVPSAPSWSWMIRAIETHSERRHWREVAPDSMGLVQAGDGSLVLMGRVERPAHIGVWLRPEQCVIHADADHGVIAETLVDVRARGWRSLRFFEPIEGTT